MRFLAKVCLGAAYNLLGKPFTSTSESSALRRIMNSSSPDPDDKALTGLTGYFASPNIHGRFPHSKLFPSHHLVTLSRSHCGIELWVSLLGYLGAYCRVSRVVLPGPLSGDEVGVVVATNWYTREVERLPLGHLLHQHRIGVRTFMGMPKR